MTTGDAPITQSGISPLVSLVSRDAQLSQVGHLCFGLLPLLPDVHSEPWTQCPQGNAGSEGVHPRLDWLLSSSRYETNADVLGQMDAIIGIEI